MPPLGQTGRQKHRVLNLSIRPSVRPSVCSFVCYKREYDIKTNEPILMQIGTSGPRDNDMKRRILGVRRSKVKVTRGGRQIWRPGGGTILVPLESSSFSSVILLEQHPITSFSRYHTFYSRIFELLLYCYTISKLCIKYMYLNRFYARQHIGILSVRPSVMFLYCIETFVTLSSPHGRPSFQFLPRDALQVQSMLSCGVCLCVWHVRTFCQNELTHLLNFFTVGQPHRSSFSVPNGMAIFRRKLPPNGASNAGGVGRNRDSEPISVFTACC